MANTRFLPAARRRGGKKKGKRKKKCRRERERERERERAKREEREEKRRKIIKSGEERRTELAPTSDIRKKNEHLRAEKLIEKRIFFFLSFTLT